MSMFSSQFSFSSQFWFSSQFSFPVSPQGVPVNRLRTRLVSLAVAAILVGSALVGSASPASARTLAEIVASGELYMLTFPHQESVFSRTDVRRGVMPRLGGREDFLGIDVDLMAAFADELGVELKIRPVSEPRYGALIPELLEGRADLIASSLTITAERRKKVEFSAPYFTVYPVILTRRDVHLAGVEDLANLVGVVTAGSSHEEHLLDLGIEPASLVRVDFSIETFAALVDGDADYTLADSLAAQRFLATEPSLHVAMRLSGSDQYGFAVPPGSELKQALDDFLARSEASGQIDRILAGHIGSALDRYGSTPRLAAED